MRGLSPSLSPLAVGRTLLGWVRAHQAPLRRVLRLLTLAVALGLGLFVLLLLSLRLYFLPHIQDYRGDVEQLLSRSLGVQVTIQEISSGWQGIRPDLGLYGVKIADQQGRPALSLHAVDALLSWSSLVRGQLILARLHIDAPELAIRRNEQGQIFIAGIALNSQAEGSAFQDWLLAQKQIQIRRARLSWDDAQRHAPTLALDEVSFTLENTGTLHTFWLGAAPPKALASRLDIRGGLKGKRLDRLQDWQGEVYAATDYADLAGWKAWLDYPLDVPQGNGHVRLTLRVADGHLAALNGDVGLNQVRLRFAPELPELELVRLAGHVELLMSQGGFQALAQNITLTTKDGVPLPGQELRLRYTPSTSHLLLGYKPAHGEFSANALDLNALQRIAIHLPLDKDLRSKLAQFAPEGQLKTLNFTWQGEGQQLNRYTLRSDFERLGMAAVNSVPGFEGLSGHVEATEQGGSLKLDSHKAALWLPKVFAEPQLPLDQLRAKLDWHRKADNPELEFHLSELHFHNKDAEGMASGSYWYQPGSQGRIDLSAQLTRGEGNAVWRYMPLVVNRDTHEWLKQGIVAGRSHEAKLRLKGRLEDFPYLDKKLGIFQVTVKFSDATLHYAPSWPEIQDISGHLIFEGKRLHIQGQKARMFGVALSNVTAEIPDLMHGNEVMQIAGQASGPTKDFLRFIDESPVAERINHFTQGMQAEGNGKLLLNLQLPLRHIKDSVVQGDYQFITNSVLPDPGIPPLTDVNGHLLFTGQGVTVKNATGRLLNGPMSLSASTRPDGTVLINTQGNLPMNGLRKLVDLPLFDHVSGTAPWRGTVSIRQRNADLVVDSPLTGVASSLPEPFNKSATETLPIHIERLQLPPGPKDGVKREQVKLQLGTVAQLQVLRRPDKQGAMSLESGSIAMQAANSKTALELPPQPSRGLAIQARVPQLNVDFWRHALSSDSKNGAHGDEAPMNLSVNLKTNQLVAMNRSFQDIALRADATNGQWQAQITSPDLAGDVTWNSVGKGRLRARLHHLSLNESKENAMPSMQEPLKQLPGLDVSVENLRVRGIDLGRLDLEANNQGDTWQMRKVNLSNPDGKLTGNLDWLVRAAEGRNPAQNRSRLVFKLDTPNSGKLLERCGFPGTVKNSAAKLEGELNWDGPPSSVDYKTLSGKLSLDANKGQFAKLNPGAGRLLGILSLQSLPRRITLDFNDIFSQGFAFDSIVGDVQVQHGSFTTQNLRIQGPAASIVMSGDADLNQETQNLRVRVQPAIGETLSVGAMFVNPVMGVATYLAQKLLKDPLGQVFEFDYRVTGSWSDPKVEKVGATLVSKPDAKGDPKP